MITESASCSYLNINMFTVFFMNYNTTSEKKNVPNSFDSDGVLGCKLYSVFLLSNRIDLENMYLKLRFFSERFEMCFLCYLCRCYITYHFQYISLFPKPHFVVPNSDHMVFWLFSCKYCFKAVANVPVLHFSLVCFHNLSVKVNLWKN